MIHILVAILAYIPALSANSLAVVFGGGPPIDSGKSWGDERILGDGKTWRGLLGGGLSAGAVGLLLYVVMSPFFHIYPTFGQAVVIAFSFSFGSLLGDIGASFVKRRMGKKRGEKAHMLDQYDFVVGSLLLALIFSPRWLLSTYFYGKGIYALILILIMTPFLHRAINILGYKLGMKKEPW